MPLLADLLQRAIGGRLDDVIGELEDVIGELEDVTIGVLDGIIGSELHEFMMPSVSL